MSGKNCEIAPNRCLGEPCLHGGVCGDFGSRLECACPKGWAAILKLKNYSKIQKILTSVFLSNFANTAFRYTGAGCQYLEDSCAPGVCKNGGECQRTSSGFHCKCTPGWNFLMWFYYLLMSAIPSTLTTFIFSNSTLVKLEDYLNNLFLCELCFSSWFVHILLRRAVPHGIKWICIFFIYHFIESYRNQYYSFIFLNLGFTGSRCETNIDDCSSNPCPESATCIDQINTHKCLCSLNMTGAECDKVRGVLKFSKFVKFFGNWPKMYKISFFIKEALLVYYSRDFIAKIHDFFNFLTYYINFA